jgi:hypothetical protein
MSFPSGRGRRVGGPLAENDGGRLVGRPRGLLGSYARMLWAAIVAGHQQVIRASTGTA